MMNASILRKLAGTRARRYSALLVVFGLALAIIPMLRAQSKSRVASVTPATGKVNENVTVAGEGLGKGAVSAVFLSDDKTDYKAAVDQQGDDKIVMKIPQVKPGSYKVSLQVGDSILIQPVRFTVE